MAVTAIDGELVALYVSADSGTTWKEIVCAEDQSLEGSRNTTSRPTKCGILKSKGPVGWSMPFAGVASITPESTQVSAQQMITYFQNGTDLDFKFAHKTDADILYREGSGFISAYTEEYPTEDYVGFSGTIEIEGDLILTEPS
jgi:hypothetical protein